MSENRDAAVIAAAVEPLIAWYAQNRKPLPWRTDPSPYHVWLSEIMLQQTRIEAAIPYYHAFLAACPDIASLAAADDDRLMKLWQGLGYYSRVRNLKKAAVAVCEQYGGRLPDDAGNLRRLPGIGDYTAGAIASIAYGRPEPAVDGNVMRVVMRLTACGEDVMKPAVRKRVTKALRAVYPSGPRAGLLTEGLMELGEVICLPGGAPRCEVCPLAALCRAQAEGDPERYPTRTKPKPRRIEEKTVLILRSDGKVALHRRGPGLLAHLWEFPMLDGTASADHVTASLAAQGLAVSDIRSLGIAVHVFSHVEWHMTGYAVTVTTSSTSGTVSAIHAPPSSPSDAVLTSSPSTWTWVTPAALASDYAIPTAFRAYAREA